MSPASSLWVSPAQTLTDQSTGRYTPRLPGPRSNLRVAAFGRLRCCSYVRYCCSAIYLLCWSLLGSVSIPLLTKLRKGPKAQRRNRRRASPSLPREGATPLKVVTSHVLKQRPKTPVQRP